MRYVKRKTDGGSDVHGRSGRPALQILQALQGLIVEWSDSA